MLAATTRPIGESFATLAAAPADSTFKGVAFAPVAPVPEPTTWLTMLAGFGLVGAALRYRGRRAATAKAD